MHLLSFKELADQLGLSSRVVQNLWRQRKIPGYRINHKIVRFDLAAVIEALKRMEEI